MVKPRATCILSDKLLGGLAWRYLVPFGRHYDFSWRQLSHKPSNADVRRSNVIFTTTKCPGNTCNIVRYILNKKCTNLYENGDADQLRGNSVFFVHGAFPQWKTDKSNFSNYFSIYLVIYIGKCALASVYDDL